MDDGREDDAHDGDQGDAAEERVTAGEDFPASVCSVATGPMPEKIIAAFKKASIHGSFSKT